jgi:hypothetical protein
VKIYFDFNLCYEDLCGKYGAFWEDYKIYKGYIRVASFGCSDCGFPKNLYQLYLMNFAYIVGFNITAIWGDPTPYEDWSTFYTIPDFMRKTVRALYKVPPGYYLGGRAGKQESVMSLPQGGIGGRNEKQ